ncbi:hypothetical protein IWW50_006726, partial [Coemansia erecta]
ASRPLGAFNDGVAGGLSRAFKRDHIPENSRREEGKPQDIPPPQNHPEESRPQEHPPSQEHPEENKQQDHPPSQEHPSAPKPREPEHPPANDHHDAPQQPPRDARPGDRPAENGGHGNSNQPERLHFEHTEHSDGNPNNVEHMSHDVVNSGGLHSNVVQHVSMSGNNINGRPSGQVVHGGKGIVINGKGNKVFTGGPHGVVFVQEDNHGSESHANVASPGPENRPHKR